MPNPLPAYEGTICDYCASVLEEGDDVFFHDGEKLCEHCAEEEEIICECGCYKKPDFKTCYECSRS